MAVPLTQYVEDFFTYQLDFPNLTFGTTQTQNIQIQADSDFKLVKLTYFADVAGAAQTDSSRVVPLVAVQITDSGSGRQLLSAPSAVPALFGTGEIPFILPVARIFKARASVAVQVSNFSAGTDYSLRLSFVGTKIFKLG